MEAKQKAKEELKEKKHNALAKVNREYYDRGSISYKDNERYSWAVESINKGFEDEMKELNKL